jgi:Transglycosylase SLT domain
VERKREAPPIVVPIAGFFRRLCRSSRPLCLGALPLCLAHLTPATVQPVHPPLLAAAAETAPVSAPASRPDLDVKDMSMNGGSPPPPAPHLPGPPLPPHARPPGEEGVIKDQAEAVSPPAPADNLETIRRAADLLAEVNAALGAPRSPYGQLIYDIAIRHQVNPQLVAAMIHVESAFNPRAVSRKGACGLMQLLPGTARRFGLTKKKDLFDPQKNLEAGVRYLKWLTQRFGGDVEKILAAYNAGEGAVERFGGIPPYRETQQYVGKIFGLLGFTTEPPPVRSASGAGVVASGR